MKKYKLYCIALIVIVLPFELIAQNSTSSPYSRFGIGELNRNGYGRNKAMGGTGIGLRTAEYLNDQNPASVSALFASEVIFDFGVMNKYTQLSDTDNSQFNKDFNLSHIALGLPIKKWWGISAGISPYSSTGYNMNKSTDIGYEQLLRESYSGSGGINKAFLNNGFNIKIDSSQTLSLGVTTSFLFGFQKQKIEVKYIEPINNSTTSINRDTYLKGFANTFGLQYTKLFKDKYRLVLGATYDLENKLNAESTINVNSNLSHISTKDINQNQTVANDTLNTGDYVLPQNIGVGFSFSTSKILVAADYKIQNWEKAAFFGKNDKTLTNAQTISAGLEYRPSIASQKYFKRVQYRLGAKYTNTHLSFDGNQVKDQSVSFGLALPLRKNYSIVNLSFELGQMGTTDNGLIKEQYGIMILNFTFHDSWFVKRKFD